MTNMGRYHQELEDQLKKYLDVPELSLMVNGHMSLELIIQAMDFPEGGEVITTPFTLISTTHAIIRNKLIPVFCDIKLDDYTIDENKIEDLITERTVAILPVHVYGNICNTKRIEQIAEKYNLKVIYDAAHAFGEKVNAKMNEFCAVMGLCNLRHVQQNIEERKKRVFYYKEKLSHMKGIVLPEFDREEV